MKSLFIAVSVVAMLYLAVQTNTVKSAIASIFTADAQVQNLLDESIFNKEQLPNKTAMLARPAESDIKFNKALVERVQALEANIINLERQLQEQMKFSSPSHLNSSGKMALSLAKENESPKSTLVDGNQNQIENKPQNLIQSTSKSMRGSYDNASIKPQSLLATSIDKNNLYVGTDNGKSKIAYDASETTYNTHDTHNTNNTHKSNNETQKRIQQQAILRALSQKMELAALSGLAN